MNMVQKLGCWQLADAASVLRYIHTGRNCMWLTHCAIPVTQNLSVCSISDCWTACNCDRPDTITYVGHTCYTATCCTCGSTLQHASHVVGKPMSSRSQIRIESMHA